MLFLSRAQKRISRECALRLSAISQGSGRTLHVWDDLRAAFVEENGTANNLCEVHEQGIIHTEEAREASNTGSNALRERLSAPYAVSSRVSPNCSLSFGHPAGFHSRASPCQSSEAQATLRGELSEDTWQGDSPQSPVPFRSQLRVKTVKDARIHPVKDTGNQSIGEAGSQSVRDAGGKKMGKSSAGRNVKDHRQQKKNTARKKQADTAITAVTSAVATRGLEGSIDGRNAHMQSTDAVPSDPSAEGLGFSNEERVGAEGHSPHSVHSQRQLGVGASEADSDVLGLADKQASLLPSGMNSSALMDEETPLLPSDSDTSGFSDSRRQALTEGASLLPPDSDGSGFSDRDAPLPSAPAGTEDDAGGPMPPTVHSLLLRLGASEADVEKMLFRRPRLAQAEAPDLPAVVSLLQSYGVPSSHVLRAAVNCPFWLTSPPGAVQEILTILVNAGVRTSKLGTILRGNSQVLCVDPDTLRTRIKWMGSADVGFRDVGAVIESWPRILGMKQETVEARIKSIKEALGEAKAVEFFNRFPRCLVRSWEQQSSRLHDLDALCPPGNKREPLYYLLLDPALLDQHASGLQPKVRFLESLVGRERAVKLISGHPRVLHLSTETLTERWERLRQLVGADVALQMVQSTLHALNVPHEVVSHSLMRWREELPDTREEQIATYSQVLARNWDENVAPKIRFLESTLGFSRSDIAVCPHILLRSLTHRIAPRVNTLKSIGVNIRPHGGTTAWYRLVVYSPREQRIKHWQGLRKMLMRELASREEEKEGGVGEAESPAGVTAMNSLSLLPFEKEDERPDEEESVVKGEVGETGGEEILHAIPDGEREGSTTKDPVVENELGQVGSEEEEGNNAPVAGVGGEWGDEARGGKRVWAYGAQVSISDVVLITDVKYRELIEDLRFVFGD